MTRRRDIGIQRHTAPMHAVIVSILLGAALSPPAAAQTFTGLGNLPDWQYGSTPTALSGDGSTVAGVFTVHGQGIFADRKFNAAFVWSTTNHWSNSGPLSVLKNGSAGVEEYTPGAVNVDGRRIVGELHYVHFGGSTAFYLGQSPPPSAGTPSTGSPPGTFDATFNSRATGLSADGGATVGTRWGSTVSLAFLFAYGGPASSLGVSPTEMQTSANAVSGDGTVVVGAVIRESVKHAMRWSQATGVVDIGILPGHALSESELISRDGRVIFGRSSNPPYWPPASFGSGFRWTTVEGMTEIRPLPGDLRAFATGTNQDGSITVGSSFDDDDENTQHTFVLHAHGGLREANAYFQSAGVIIPADWGPLTLQFVSDDARTYVGYATHNGLPEGWRITLPADCNGNAIDDADELADHDCNANGKPDECDPDSDGDGRIDDCDNCKITINPDQADTDGDGSGDACDQCPGIDDRLDADADNVPDCIDNCLATANPDQTDANADGIGDACQPPTFCCAPGICLPIGLLMMGFIAARRRPTRPGSHYR